jgi:hypothetical protein
MSDYSRCIFIEGGIAGFEDFGVDSLLIVDPCTLEVARLLAVQVDAVLLLDLPGRQVVLLFDLL